MQEKERQAQLPLSLRLKDEATFANFYPGRNTEIITELAKTASGSGERMIYLCGSRGQGRSHLLQAACHQAHQQQLTSVYLPLGSLQNFSPDMLDGLESLSLVCIDDLHVIAGRLEWEEAVFHLYNRIHDAGNRLVIAANDLPKQIALHLPDLISRLSWGIVYQLHALTDEEKLAALTMRADSRGISLSEETAKYILNHCPRHMGTLLAALDALDNASLAAQRRLTIPFVKEVLQV
jgi:DnaA-homolog protein